MSERPEEDILLTPEYTILEFGDGYFALVQGGIESQDEEGQIIIEFTIKPSEKLRKRYSIKDSMLNQNGQLKFKVKKTDLIPINQFDDANKKWLYVKTFNHQDTEISKIGWNLRKRLEEMQKRVIVLEGELIWYSEQLQLAKTNPAEFVSQGTDIFEKVSSSILNLMKGKGNKEDY